MFTHTENPQTRFVQMKFPDYENLTKMILTEEQIAALVTLMEDLDGDLTSAETAALDKLRVMATVDISPTMTKIRKIMSLMKEKYERIQESIAQHQEDERIRGSRHLRRRTVGGY